MTREARRREERAERKGRLGSDTVGRFNEARRLPPDHPSATSASPLLTSPEQAHRYLDLIRRSGVGGAFEARLGDHPGRRSRLRAEALLLAALLAARSDSLIAASTCARPSTASTRGSRSVYASATAAREPPSPTQSRTSSSSGSRARWRTVGSRPTARNGACTGSVNGSFARRSPGRSPRVSPPSLSTAPSSSRGRPARTTPAKLTLWQRRGRSSPSQRVGRRRERAPFAAARADIARPRLARRLDQRDEFPGRCVGGPRRGRCGPRSPGELLQLHYLPPLWHATRWHKPPYTSSVSSCGTLFSLAPTETYVKDSNGLEHQDLNVPLRTALLRLASSEEERSAHQEF